jgi:hypothetical protein
MGFLVLQTEAFHLTVEGVDTPDTDPLVLQTRCRVCGIVVHARVLEATQAVVKVVRSLAAEDARQARGHQARCRGLG